MQTPKIFVTGVTGYIAGDVMHALYDERPNYEYSLLVRTKEKAKLVQEAFPKARIVIGDLDQSDLLEKEAKHADIVIHAADASDHEGAAKAIARGLIKGHTKETPGFWIHTGGTGILTFTDSRNDFAGLGSWSEKEYNDLDGVDELTSLPDDAFHRNVDKLVLATGIENQDVVKTVIVCPPTIYGKGRGPVSNRGRQVYELAKLILSTGKIPIVGQGKARWNNVHVHDLTDVYRLLVNKAVGKVLDNEIWGAKGYFLTENGEHIWTDIAKDIAREAELSKYISPAKEYQLSKDEALEQAGFEAVSWGLNSRGKAERARKFLDWNPSRLSLQHEIPSILAEERQRMKGDGA